VSSRGGAIVVQAPRSHRFTGSRSPLIGYLSEELSIRPGRLTRAIRLAMICTVGNGLMAAAHVDSILGSYLLWAVAAAPRAMMTPREATRLIATQGLMLAMAVPLAGVLVEAPWMYVPLFAIFVSVHVYFVKRYNLSNAWLLIGVTVLDTFYGIIFDPDNFGWDAAATFGGAVLAFGTIMLFDSFLWPDPAEAELLESIGVDLERSRDRLLLVRGGFFDERRRAEVPRAPAISDLPTHLTLLNRAGREGASTRRKAELLAVITANERLHLEVAKVLAIARSRVPMEIRHLIQPETEEVLAALAAAIDQMIAHVATGLVGPYAPPEAALDRVAAALKALDARSAAIGFSRMDSADPAEVSNLSALFLALHHVARLTEPRAEYPTLAAGASHKPEAPPSLFDPELLRYCTKLAVAMTVMLVISLTAQRPEFTAALWTVLITGLPTYGATMRKMMLRFGGVAVGGTVALATIIVVTPNFDTVLSYMIVTFAVLIFFAWAAQSSSRIAYAGSQAGTTFVLVFAGLSPSEQIYGPLWRVWSVVLGVVVTAIVFLLVWPEYAGDTMLPRLKKLLGLNLKLIPAHGAPLDDAAIDEIETDSTNTLSELLGIADDARLEGPRCGVRADSIVDAAGSLRRIAHRLGAIAAGYSRVPALSAETEIARDRVGAAFAERLLRWQEYFEAGRPFNLQAAAVILARNSRDLLEQNVEDLARRLSAASYAEIAAWPLGLRRTILAEIESWRRIVVLAGELDQQFFEIPAERTVTARLSKVAAA
jgi:uncharacterized membrane protein YccC